MVLDQIATADLNSLLRSSRPPLAPPTLSLPTASTSDGSQGTTPCVPLRLFAFRRRHATVSRPSYVVSRLALLVDPMRPVRPVAKDALRHRSIASTIVFARCDEGWPLAANRGGTSTSRRRGPRRIDSNIPDSVCDVAFDLGVRHFHPLLRDDYHEPLPRQLKAGEGARGIEFGLAKPLLGPIVEFPVRPNQLPLRQDQALGRGTNIGRNG